MATDGDWQVAQTRNAKAKVKAYWDGRARLGEKAGSQDLILHQLEVQAIALHIRDDTTILDIGCGNGATLTELSQRFPKCLCVGVDYSEAMIEAARSRIQQSPCFFYGDVLEREQLADIAGFFGQFDTAYTKRALINLKSWQEQKQAIENICSLLKPGGIYVMCESSQDGLDEINQLRAAVALPVIEPPFHNRYLRDEEIGALRIESAAKMHCSFEPPFSSTYYFLSRIVNAALAVKEGREPAYDSPINQLALRLPSIEGLRGQSRIWVWRKNG